MSQEAARPTLESRIETRDLAILKLSSKLFEPHRILLLKSLFLQGQLDFRQLKHGLGISDGNLYSHLRALQQQDYIVVSKEIVDNKVRTTYEMTPKGKEDFEGLLQALRSLASVEDLQ
jgi:DNA-binding PadR family transcriptional regulator